jgi:hypothetical protein
MAIASVNRPLAKTALSKKPMMSPTMFVKVAFYLQQRHCMPTT